MVVFLVTTGSFLRRIRIQRGSSTVELFFMQPPGKGTGVHGGEPSPHGGSIKREEEQVVHFQTMENAIFHTIRCSPFLQGIGTFNVLFLTSLTN